MWFTAMTDVGLGLDGGLQDCGFRLKAVRLGVSSDRLSAMANSMTRLQNGGDHPLRHVHSQGMAPTGYIHEKSVEEGAD